MPLRADCRSEPFIKRHCRAANRVCRLSVKVLGGVSGPIGNSRSPPLQSACYAPNFLFRLAPDASIASFDPIIIHRHLRRSVSEGSEWAIDWFHDNPEALAGTWKLAE